MLPLLPEAATVDKPPAVFYNGMGSTTCTVGPGRASQQGALISMKQPMIIRRNRKRTVRPRLWFFLGLFLVSTTILLLMLTKTIPLPGGTSDAASIPSAGMTQTDKSNEPSISDPSPAATETTADAEASTPASASTAVASSDESIAADVQETEDETAATVSMERTPGHENMPEYATVTPIGNADALKGKVQEMLSTFPGKYGVTFVNLATGERFGIQDTDEYIAASTSKFPMNILLWKRIAAGEIDPESLLTYKQEDLETGTGVIQNEPYGTQYTVRETSRLSVIYSDNCGINMIIRLLDIEDIRQYIRDQGGVVEYGKRHRSCPSDMANCAVDLYRFYYEDPAVAGELIDFLENTKWNERINGQLPADVKVAHKIGNQTMTANDVGIVFATQPYVLSVMTENVDFDAACRNISKLSKMIYEEVEAAAAR